MITKINAELDSIETADLAARMIKQRTGGIISIKIDNKDNNKQHEDDFDYIMPVVPYGGISNNEPFNNTYSNSYMGGFVNFDEHRAYDSREISRAVVIDIICEKEAENTVMQVFTSLGGLKINKN